MTDWFLLRLPDDAQAAPAWALANEAGQLLTVPAPDIDTMSAAASGRRVALLVPGAAVSEFLAPLPPANDARLMQLAPFALEDQVSQDVEQLHFAVGARDAASGAVAVSVVEREQMQRWLDQAAEWQLAPNAVYAETALAPALPGHVTMVVTGDQLLLRQDDARPLLLPANDPALALDMLLDGRTELSAVHLVVYASSLDWQHHARAIEALREQVATFKVQLTSGGVLALLAPGLAQPGLTNLLQGAYKPRTSSAGVWQQWRWAAALAGALLLLHGLGSWWQLRQMRKASVAMDASIAQLYGAVFPGQTPGIDPRLAMEKRFKSLAGDANQQGELLHQLAAVAAAKQNVPVTRLQSLTFKPGSLQLKLSAPDASTLEQFSQALRGSGYTAQVVAGGVQGTAYEGEVELRNPGT